MMRSQKPTAQARIPELRLRERITILVAAGSDSAWGHYAWGPAHRMVLDIPL